MKSLGHAVAVERGHQSEADDLMNTSVALGFGVLDVAGAGFGRSHSAVLC